MQVSQFQSFVNNLQQFINPPCAPAIYWGICLGSIREK